MPLLIVVLGIILLFLLIAVFKLNAFLSFIIVCLLVGILQGMELEAVIQSIQNGIGSTLGFLVLILGLGAMLGKLVAESGAAQRITSGLVERFGRKYIQWAVVMTVAEVAETPALLPNQEIAKKQTSARQIYHHTSP